MKQLYIYGCSDDLIEIEGDHNDELSAFGGTKLNIRDYITLDIEYLDGDWKIKILEDKSPHDWKIKKIGCNDEFIVLNYPDDTNMKITIIEED